MRPTPEHLRDAYEPAEMQRNVSRIEAQTMSNIRDVSADTRNAMYRTLGRSVVKARGKEGKQLHQEARMQYFDRSKDQRHKEDMQELQHRATRAAVAERVISDSNRPFTLAAKGKDTAGNDVEVSVLVRSARDPKKKRAKIFADRSEQDVAEAVKGKNANDLRKMGLEVTGTNFSNFSDEQAKVFAKKHEMFRQLPAILSTGGVNSWNVQQAMECARLDPEAALEAIQAKHKDDEDEKKVEALVHMHDLLGTLTSIEREPYSKNFKQVTEELDKVEHDSDHLTAAVPATSKLGIDELSALGAVDFKSLAPADRRTLRDSLHKEQEKLRKVQQYYVRLQSTLTRLKEATNLAGKNLPKKLQDFFEANGDFKIHELKGSVDPSILTDALKTEFDLKPKEDYQKKLQELRAHEKHDDEPTTKVGREAVMAIYEKFIPRYQRTTPQQTAEMARELYARNSIGRSETEFMRDILDNPEVTGEKHGHLRIGPRVKELFSGAEETYICNLVRSPAMDLQRSRGNKKFLKGTKRLGLWTKHKARPRWGAMSFPELIVAYGAIRESIKQKQISSTPYVRTQLDEVGRLLATLAAQENLIALESQDLTEEQRAQLRGTPEGLRIKADIAAILAGETPPAYQDAVKDAIAYAKKHTGRVRKALVANRVKNLWTGKGSKLNPLTWAARLLRAPFTKKESAKKKEEHKKDSRAKKIYNYLFHETAPLYNPVKKSGGGGGGDKSHG